MTPSFQAGSYTLLPIADTSGRFCDFMPYVVSVNNDGVVAFQATLRGGGSGVYTGDGGPIRTVADSATGPFHEVCSHPDINRDGSTCFYASLKSGGRGLFLARGGEIFAVADSAGPLGPTMNEAGMIAFRVDLISGGSGIFSAGGGVISSIADTTCRFSMFHGLPVINNTGAVAFRADLRNGGQGIYVTSPTREQGSENAIVETGDIFISLGSFPTMNDAGTVAFCATLRAGGSGVFAASKGKIATVLDTSGPFESFRGVLLNNANRIVFSATPSAGALGVFAGRDPVADCLFSLDAPLLGSTVADFALNPVSINDAGQIALRVRLTDQRHFVLRADPVNSSRHQLLK
ncbi:MAG: hypothetical protein L0215_25230 [Gemmataceae bacterium]|nr:hypothetical protein [Gemmataceae bacterium]